MEYKEIALGEIQAVATLHNELSDFIQRTVNDDYWSLANLIEDEVQKHLETFINNPERKIFVAKDKETIVGFMSAEIINCYLPISSIKKVGYIAAAYVIPEYRNMKIISSLEKQAIAFFKECNLKYVELNYLTENRIAKKAWENLGYKTFRAQARKKI